jgi:serine protease Do
MKIWNSGAGARSCALRMSIAGLVLLAVVQPVAAQPAPAAPPAPPAPPEISIMRFTGSGSFLGVGVAEIDSARARELNLAEERGVEITKVEANSPADKAGLKVGDVVLEYNGQRVEGTEQFVRLVRETPPGRTARLLVSRGGSQVAISAVIGSRKDRAKAAMAIAAPLGGGPRIWIPDMPRVFAGWRSQMLGIEVEGIDGQLADFFGVKQGVLVRSVASDSAGEKGGLKAGDVIVRVENEAVSSPREVTDALREYRDRKSVAMTVVRDRKQITLTVPLDEASSGSEPRRGRSLTHRNDRE